MTLNCSESAPGSAALLTAFPPLAAATANQTVTALPAAELQDRVYGAASRPCAGRDPDEYFPPEQGPGSGNWRRIRETAELRARAACRFCPVELDCLELAIRTEGPRRGYGVAGGTMPWQRQAIKASRGLAVRRA